MRVFTIAGKRLRRGVPLARVSGAGAVGGAPQARVESVRVESVGVERVRLESVGVVSVVLI
jgi:hypothetical protein